MSWRAKPTAGHDRHGQSVVYDESNGRTIAVVYEGLGNADLIAASPDLLAACKAMIEQLEGIGIPDWHGAEGLDLDTMHAAIAKAEGG